MENFQDNLLKYKKDPLTLIHKMQQLLQQKNAEIEALTTKINFIQLPMKSPIIYQQSFIYNGPVPDHQQFYIPDQSHFITLTFDPSFFLPKTESDQVNFITELLYQQLSSYDDLYGCFEHHKSGIIHFHGVFNVSSPQTLYEMLLYFKNKLTIKSTKSVNSKIVTDCQKLFNDYLIKENFITLKKKNS